MSGSIKFSTGPKTNNIQKSASGKRSKIAADSARMNDSNTLHIQWFEKL